MGVECQILLQKTKDGVFRAGQPVIGALKYFVKKPTKFSSVYISLVGKGKCSWSETDSDNNSTTYSNAEEYVSLKRYLFMDETCLSGTYESPFQFMLPENLPTSVKNRTCTIEYKVKVKFVKANFFKSDDKFDALILVYGYVNPCSPEPLVFGLQKKLLSLTSNNKVNIRAEIERTFITPGENIKLMLMITNNSNVPVTIKSELCKHFTYVASNKKEKVERESVKTTTGYSPRVKENSVSKLTCIVPTLPSLYSIQHTKILRGEYKVKVTAQFPFPHIAAAVEVPVVIGESRDHLGATVRYYDNPSYPKKPEKYDKYNMNEHNADTQFGKYYDSKELRSS